MQRAEPGRAPLSTCQKTSVEMNPLKLGGGARGGSRPPRMGSNASESLLCKDSGKRSEDFCAAVRCKSNGIFQAVEKVSRLFRQPGAEPGRAPLSLYSEGLQGFYEI